MNNCSQHKNIIVIAVLVLFISLTTAFAQKVGWEKVIGDSAYNERTWSKTIVKTADDGYIITGSKSYLANPRQLYLLQIDSIGNVIRDSTLVSGEGTDILPTKAGGYIIGGYGSGPGFLLIKVNSKWDTLWKKNFPDNDNWMITHLYETSDSLYLLIGGTWFDDTITSGEMSVIKTDTNGNQIWSKTYGTPYPIQEDGGGGYELPNGDYLFVSISYNVVSNYKFNTFLVRANQNGDTIFTKTISGNKIGGGVYLQHTDDNNFILVGGTAINGGGNGDLSLFKLNENGDTLWTRIYGGNNDDFGLCVQQLSNSDFIITGETRSYDVKGDVYLLRTDSGGNLLWEKTYGGYDEDEAYAVIQTNDGGFLLAGNTQSFGDGMWDDIYFIKTDSNGCIVIPEASFTASDTANAGFPFSFTNTSFTDTSLSIKIVTYQWLVNGALYDTTKNLNTQFVTPGNYLITLIADNGNCQDTAYKTITVTTGMEDIKLAYPYLGNNVPNPFSSQTVIDYYVPSVSEPATINIYDIAGKMLRAYTLEKGKYGKIIINDGEIERGVYLYDLMIGNKKIAMKKMVMLAY